MLFRNRKIGGDFPITSILPFIGYGPSFFPTVTNGRTRYTFETGVDSFCAIATRFWGHVQEDAHSIWFPSHFCNKTVIRIKNILSQQSYIFNVQFYDPVTDLHAIRFGKNDIVIWLHFNSHKIIPSETLNLLKAQGVFLLEDFVLCPFDIIKVVGDAAINSLRKVSPLNVSVAYTFLSLDKYVSSYKYSEMRRIGAWKKAFFEIMPSETAEEEYLHYLRTAEQLLELRTGVFCPMSEDLFFFENINWEKVVEKRRHNYAILYQKLRSIQTRMLDGEYQFLMLDLANRDQIREALFSSGIFAPIHWADSRSEFRKRQLSIPVDQRYDISDMEYIADILISRICPD